MAAADIIFYNGLMLEGRLSDILVRMARQKPTVAVSEYVPRGALDRGCPISRAITIPTYGLMFPCGSRPLSESATD